MEQHVYDMLIIGGGPAGYTAGLYAGRAGLDAVVLERPGAMAAQLANEDITYIAFAEGKFSAQQSKDYKTELQTLLQKDGEVSLEYEVLRTEGPPHDTTFFVQLSIDGKACSKGKGKSKKRAEQEAAKAALENLSKEEK